MSGPAFGLIENARVSDAAAPPDGVDALDEEDCARAAREIAEACFDSGRVLSGLLSAVGVA